MVIAIPRPEVFCEQEAMVDAVVAEDGFTYSLAGIQGWFETGKRSSPMTGLEIGATLRPDWAMRQKAQTASA
jgi:hypothetical protein